MMASYQIEWKRSAVKELEKLSPQNIHRIIKTIETLIDNPRPTNARKLIGSDYTYRLRVGDYRVVYSIFESSLIIEIVKVGHRRDIYR